MGKARQKYTDAFTQVARAALAGFAGGYGCRPRGLSGVVGNGGAGSAAPS
jgi:hypothetical protein